MSDLISTPPSSAKERTRNAAIVIASVLAALALAEGGLRYVRAPRLNHPFWTGSIGIHKRSSDPTLIYELVPGSRSRREGVEIKINSAGFRDDEFPESLPEGARRIVVLGDSVAWGYGVPMASAFPQVLERLLRERPAGPFASSVVYNLAVDGYSTEQEIRLLETRGLALRPDLVIVSYVLNDPDTFDGGLARYYSSRIELLDLVETAWTNTRDRLSRYPREYHHLIHARHKDTIIDQFHRLGTISRERKVPILVAVTPVFRFDRGAPYPWRDLHELIRGLCEDNGLAFLDLYPAFEGRDPGRYARDVWHPTIKGHALIAETIAGYLRERGDRINFHFPRANSPAHSRSQVSGRDKGPSPRSTCRRRRVGLPPPRYRRQSRRTSARPLRRTAERSRREGRAM